MSSMRNAVQRRNHRERAQPIEREKWGILEKHKDYALRARDYKAKQKRLEILRKKAAERNPDEFHFGMSRAKAHDKGQKVADRGNPVLSHDAVKLLKTQDAGYLKTMAQATRKKRERLEEEILVQEGIKGLEGQDGRRHVVFVESREEQKNVIEILKGSKTNDNDDHDDVDDGSENDQSQPGQRRSDKIGNQKEDLSTLKNERRLQKLSKRAQEGRLSKLKLLKIREKELLAAERELEFQRARMSNSIGGVNKAGFKWKVRERKK